MEGRSCVEGHRPLFERLAEEKVLFLIWRPSRLDEAMITGIESGLSAISQI